MLAVGSKNWERRARWGRGGGKGGRGGEGEKGCKWLGLYIKTGHAQLGGGVMADGHRMRAHSIPVRTQLMSIRRAARSEQMPSLKGGAGTALKAGTGAPPISFVPTSLAHAHGAHPPCRQAPRPPLPPPPAPPPPPRCRRVPRSLTSPPSSLQAGTKGNAGPKLPKMPQLQDFQFYNTARLQVSVDVWMYVPLSRCVDA